MKHDDYYILFIFVLEAFRTFALHAAYLVGRQSVA
jgi:hypothetical protein